MAIDDLKKDVSDYAAKKKNYDRNREMLDAELDKLDDMRRFAALMDEEVVQAVSDVGASLETEHQELLREKEELEGARDALTDRIEGEQRKLEGVKRKIDRLSGSRFAKGLSDVSRRSDEMLTELDRMLQELENPGRGDGSRGPDALPADSSNRDAPPPGGGSPDGHTPADGVRRPEPMQPVRQTPRNLPASQYGFTPDANGVLTYDSPLEMSRYLYAAQGSANPRFRGTCGLCSCANVLRLAGVNYGEKEMIDYASSAKVLGKPFTHLCTVHPLDAGKSGGTTPEQRRLILEHFGIGSSVYPLKTDSSGQASWESISDIGTYAAEGRGVIVDVDAGVFYQNPFYNGLGHAVTVTSVTKDKYGGVSGFYIQDSNRGTAYYPAWQIREALRPFVGVNVTTQIIR